MQSVNILTNFHIVVFNPFIKPRNHHIPNFTQKLLSTVHKSAAGLAYTLATVLQAQDLVEPDEHLQPLAS